MSFFDGSNDHIVLAGIEAKRALKEKKTNLAKPQAIMAVKSDNIESFQLQEALENSLKEPENVHSSKQSEQEAQPETIVVIDDDDPAVLTEEDDSPESFSVRLLTKDNDINLLKFPFHDNVGNIESAAKGLTELAAGESPKRGFPLLNVQQITIGQYKHINPLIIRKDKDAYWDDALINLWIKWITRATNANRVCRSTVLVLDSTFYATLEINKTGWGPAKCSTLSAVKNNTIFDMKLILVPICNALHWSLCVIVNPGFIEDDGKVDKNGRFIKEGVDIDKPFPCILYLDSGGSNINMESYCNHIRVWLNYEWKKRKSLPARTKNIYKSIVSCVLTNSSMSAQ